MKFEELRNLQVDGCEHRNEYPYAVDYPLSYSEPIIKNTQGEFICDKHSILEYNDYEMKFYEDYEICEIPSGRSLLGNYYYLKPVKPKKITYLFHTRKQMIDLILQLRDNRRYYEKQRMVKEKLINLENDFK